MLLSWKKNLDCMESHLLPEGGTEQTNTAPVSFGYGVSSSRNVQSA